MRDTGFKIEKIHSFKDISKNSITAVFSIGFIRGKVLSTLNERGWDIPGGHVHPDEDLIQALLREG
jgi:8-oxo-dGTP pyrophosphatase MutT (NUDIX family)